MPVSATSNARVAVRVRMGPYLFEVYLARLPDRSGPQLAYGLGALMAGLSVASRHEHRLSGALPAGTLAPPNSELPLSPRTWAIGLALARNALEDFAFVLRSVDCKQYASPGTAATT